MPLAPPFTKGLTVLHTVDLFPSAITTEGHNQCSDGKGCKDKLQIQTYILSLFYADTVL